jgi:CarboxypepD_reg-like domain
MPGIFLLKFIKKEGMNLTKIVAFFLLLLFTNISVYSQSGSIAGKVADSSDNSSLWGANIMLVGTSIGTTTNQEGKYRLTNLPEGESIIVFRYLGYAPDSVKVNVTGGKTLQLDVKLHSLVIQGLI